VSNLRGPGGDLGDGSGGLADQRGGSGGLAG
jgi:hypothetical protein